MPESVITSLAILKVNWDRGRDYIDLFIPLVADCLRRSPAAEVSLTDVQVCMREQSGLKVPQAALVTILVGPLSEVLFPKPTVFTEKTTPLSGRKI